MTMASEGESQRTLHVPPKYDLYGRRQVWFFETGNRRFDRVANGFIFGLLHAVFIVAAVVSARGGLL